METPSRKQNILDRQAVNVIDSVVIDKLRERYLKIHPLIFHRSVEHAKDAAELFEILDEFPNEYPITWNEISRRWAKQEFLYDAE